MMLHGMGMMQQSHSVPPQSHPKHGRPPPFTAPFNVAVVVEDEELLLDEEVVMGRVWLTGLETGVAPIVRDDLFG
jgi:hypothetical protein